jgi:hypothetical protein
MVIKRIIFICGLSRQHKKLLQIIFKKMKEICAMLDRSIIISEPLVHSIPISEVKDLKSDVLRALKGFLFEKSLWTLFAGSILTIFKKEKLHTLWISSCNIYTVGIEKKLNFVSNSFFSFITYPFLLIDFWWSIKIKFIKFLNF